MAKVSLSQAAKDTGVSLPTLSRWRKNGKITAEKNDSGGYLIDTSEYDRINDIRKSSPNMKGVASNNKRGANAHNETPNETSSLQVEVQILHERLKLKNSELELKDKEINIMAEKADDLKNQRDSWQKQAETLLLKKTDSDSEEQGTEEQKSTDKKKGFFGRMFG